MYAESQDESMSIATLLKRRPPLEKFAVKRDIIYQPCPLKGLCHEIIMRLCFLQVRSPLFPFTWSLTLHSANKRYVCQLKSMWPSRVVNLATVDDLLACSSKTAHPLHGWSNFWAHISRTSASFEPDHPMCRTLCSNCPVYEWMRDHGKSCR